MQKYIYTAVFVILLLLSAFLLLKLIVIKINLKKMKEEIEKTKEDSYNRNLRVTLADKDLEKLAARINENIDYQKRLKLALMALE